MRRALAAKVHLVLLPAMVGACSGPGQSPSVGQNQPPPPAAATQPSAGARLVEFQPGLRIDYRVPQVEIDGEIILREGALELFAYAKAPTPKEHESIVMVRSRPLAVYQALGLIGLMPGQPPRYDAQTRQSRPPSGDRVDVLVRYEKDGRKIEESACNWMWNVATKSVMAPSVWLFTGSQRQEDGTFAADFEGTLVTVVDFPSSVLGPPALHSDSDAELWLKARTDVIPPLGTKVVLILRPAAPKGASQAPARG